MPVTGGGIPHEPLRARPFRLPGMTITVVRARWYSHIIFPLPFLLLAVSSQALFTCMIQLEHDRLAPVSSAHAAGWRTEKGCAPRRSRVLRAWPVLRTTSTRSSAPPATARQPADERDVSMSASCRASERDRSRVAWALHAAVRRSATALINPNPIAENFTSRNGLFSYREHRPREGRRRWPRRPRSLPSPRGRQRR